MECAFDRDKARADFFTKLPFVVNYELAAAPGALHHYLKRHISLSQQLNYDGRLTFCKATLSVSVNRQILVVVGTPSLSIGGIVQHGFHHHHGADGLSQGQRRPE